jgi:aspartate/glutamate racemase
MQLILETAEDHAILRATVHHVLHTVRNGVTVRVVEVTHALISNIQNSKMETAVVLMFKLFLPIMILIKLILVVTLVMPLVL